jgi:hypothetical protein
MVDNGFGDVRRKRSREVIVDRIFEVFCAKEGVSCRTGRVVWKLRESYALNTSFTSFVDALIKPSSHFSAKSTCSAKCKTVPRKVGESRAASLNVAGLFAKVSVYALRLA